MAQKNFADALNQVVNGSNGLAARIDAKLSTSAAAATYAEIDSPNLMGTPTAPTPDNDTDSTQIATTEFCQNLIRRLVGAAPETLNTLVELAVAINNDPDFANTIVQALDAKLNKTDAATTYLTKTDASSTYLTQTNASSTYATKTELSNVSVNDSNYAKLNAENTFSQNQNFGTSDILLRNMKIRGTNMGGRIYSKGRFFLEADSDSFVLLPNCTDIGQTTSDTSGTLYFGSDSSPCSITWDASAKILSIKAENGVYANNTKIG